MRRRQRTEILINGSHALAQELAQSIIGNYRVTVIQAPEHGLVMLKLRETSQRSLFYPGEVFVTECKVQINCTIGIGIVMGDNHELAHNLAVIDAAYEAGLPETAQWTDRLLIEEQNIAAQQAKRNQAILKTKVNFETMDV
ncbi:phosphonate C-P lyase system protein PhnG [Metabacillus malikii]|uniref:Alpha-D-ribose 1-methylphosphonate 5-triphosphate synthase subunit PhnG n=1 Tax=Metabacillus malikii TaxID=1504265 RepID=A0ABT9ZKB4_9BACI|nr:phosphonate C-P lyase system protein PhnG [Metabacillus malikii]MDQ0232738.1 alpha-D-ribose 1-methylphosphonate 5-triphosphate synthase subunit PhnG [Metabacillus malikii]